MKIIQRSRFAGLATLLVALFTLALTSCESPLGGSSSTTTVSKAATVTPWTPGTVYHPGDVVTYKNELYSCMFTNTAISGYTDPPIAPALWKDIGPVTIPAVPTVVQINPRFLTETLYWNIPTGATSFDLQLTKGPLVGLGPIQVTVINGVTPPFNVPGLQTFAKYTFAVRAVSSAGASAWSTPLNNSWGDPILYSPPTGLKVTAPAYNTVQVSWDWGNFQNFDLTVDGVVVQNVRPPYFHMNLKGNSTHTYSVRGLTNNGQSNFSATVTITTPPQAWQVGATYAVGDVVTYQGSSYKCIVAHTAYVATWDPADTPSLWQKL